ncbi:RNA polymerase subunit sigma [Acidovorax sp. Leaf76]|uniref:sigma-70 family RNA polymerase sigma factor n=1 Tax=unclassified Acidovorax TaxID=2684926 RepID=UPI0006F8FEF6|nr:MULTISPECIES: sigma-70 family RNA polymerase sigma factor [unclassified Acidovorax]KQO12532.1 RNA polymerase subunit sigma [Acidovorax sp. Leaf76]KQO30142.1 RNA polymerase subunit sigma [Acidovorax sp. Leaf84]KQS28791.1 RNA polymerase subunit sigma [Acidovorax sp. Leaf191]RZJ61972.1 MAG: sigma-70 family RNA polymerase sigma factor [Acidovorax sp.]
MTAADASQVHSPHTLYSDHSGWLRAWLYRRLGCRDEAADLAQDTFVRVLLRPQVLQSLREPRAYLTTIAKGLVCDHWRRQALEQAYADALALMPEPMAPSPEERALILEALHAIDAMLEGLAPKARHAFLLSQLEGLGYAEIAQQLQVSERTVKRYMAQGFECCLLAMA